ncbi:hypothetical protein P7C73_g3375, partial [Tremellales sp. Uapishka_1]
MPPVRHLRSPVSSTPPPPPETQFIELSDDSQNLWNADKILDQRGPTATGEYLIQWLDIDPKTNKKYESTWEKKSGCTKELVDEWKERIKKDPSLVGRYAEAAKVKVEQEKHKRQTAIRGRPRTRPGSSRPQTKSDTQSKPPPTSRRTRAGSSVVPLPRAGPSKRKAVEVEIEIKTSPLSKKARVLTPRGDEDEDEDEDEELVHRSGERRSGRRKASASASAADDSPQRRSSRTAAQLHPSYLSRASSDDSKEGRGVKLTSHGTTSRTARKARKLADSDNDSDFEIEPFVPHGESSSHRTARSNRRGRVSCSPGGQKNLGPIPVGTPSKFQPYLRKTFNVSSSQADDISQFSSPGSKGKSEKGYGTKAVKKMLDGEEVIVAVDDEDEDGEEGDAEAEHEGGIVIEENEDVDNTGEEIVMAVVDGEQVMVALEDDGDLDALVEEDDVHPNERAEGNQPDNEMLPQEDDQSLPAKVVVRIIDGEEVRMLESGSTENQEDGMEIREDTARAEGERIAEHGGGAVNGLMPLATEEEPLQVEERQPPLQSESPLPQPPLQEEERQPLEAEDPESMVEKVRPNVTEGQARHQAGDHPAGSQATTGLSCRWDSCTVVFESAGELARHVGTHVSAVVHENEPNSEITFSQKNHDSEIASSQIPMAPPSQLPPENLSQAIPAVVIPVEPVPTSEEIINDLTSRLAAAKRTIKSRTDESDYVRDQYRLASDRAYAEVQVTTALRAEIATLKTQLDTGLKQRDIFNGAVRGQQATEVKQLNMQMKFLLDQARQTDDEVRKRASLYTKIKKANDQLKNEKDDMARELFDQRKALKKLEKRNEKLADEVSVWRGRTLGAFDDPEAGVSASGSGSESESESESERGGRLSQMGYDDAVPGGSSVVGEEEKDEQEVEGEVLDGPWFNCKYREHETVCPVSLQTIEQVLEHGRDHILGVINGQGVRVD